MPNLFTIPASVPFAKSLADEVIRRLNAENDPLALSRATIYVPTRRAVRFLGEVFAHAAGGAALLPDIRALGDVDEDDELFEAISENIELPPPISPLRRRVLLARLILQWQRARSGEPFGFVQALQLAKNLGGFLDEVQIQGADLSKLSELAPATLSAHWNDVREFLDLLVTHWPPILADENKVDHVAHRDGALRALADRLEKQPPEGMMIAAGSTGSIPATAHLLGVISRLPNGAVILPGLDLSLDEDSWEKLVEGHPQFGMKQLLNRIGAERKDVRIWGLQDAVPTPREILLREALRPAPTTDAWRALAESGSDVIEKGLDGLLFVEAEDPAQEASSIALMLREALETKQHTAALVTPDRNLARRVAAELKRWDIDIDDSAGRPLSRTVPGAYLCLICDAAVQSFAPVPLLALLKHPLASGRENTARFREMVRQLDLCLRGPRPDEGLTGISKAILGAERVGKDRKQALFKWFAGIEKIFEPIANAMNREMSIAEWASLHIEAAEKLAASDNETGAERLWRDDAGRAAQNLALELFIEAGPDWHVDGKSYAHFFRLLMEESVVRPTFGRHPRLAILGPLEARLQHFDLVILGGLNEGTWPRDAAADPWLSRPMRRKLGLDQPERGIGQSAHDFATLAAAPNVILTRSRKVDGSPAVASRWMQRLIQLTRGLNCEDKLCSPPRDYCAIAAALNRAERVAPTARPEPKPPISARPRKLSVTEIETWLRDPYALYAKHVLRLKPLDPLDAEIGALERGTAIHKALELFTKTFPDGPPEDADIKLIEIAEGVFTELAIPKAVMAVWRPRFFKAAQWFVQEDRKLRAEALKTHVELQGKWTFPAPGGEFELRARADRIDVRPDGTAAIIDYKSGLPPSERQVRNIWAPQLPLEAAILSEGGFTEMGKLDPGALIYIRFSGGEPPGEIREIKADAAELAAQAKALLIQRVTEFDNEDTSYKPRMFPFRSDIEGEYDHLARVKEWSVSGWSDEE